MNRTRIRVDLGTDKKKEGSVGVVVHTEAAHGGDNPTGSFRFGGVILGYTLLGTALRVDHTNFSNEVRTEIRDAFLIHTGIAEQVLRYADRNGLNIVVNDWGLVCTLRKERGRLHLNGNVRIVSDIAHFPLR